MTNLFESFAIVCIVTILGAVFFALLFKYLLKLEGHRVKPKPAPKKREASERPSTKPITLPTEFVPPYRRTIRVPRAGSKASTDLGKHMKKHGRQSSGYRASVKRKLQPEED